MRRGLPIIVGSALSFLPALLVAWLATDREPVEAGVTSQFARAENADLVKYVQSGAATNRRLVALEVIRKRGGTADLEAIARGKSVVMAAFAAGGLGRQRTSDSKKILKDLITDAKLGAEVRKAAMSALAVHWKDSDDLAWLEQKTGSDSVTEGHYAWVKTCVYGK